MKKIKSILAVLLIAVLSFSFVSCTSGRESGKSTYEKISASQAKEIIDTQKDVIILDVRTEEEYKEGHIQNAVLIPDYEIAEKAEEKLPDKDALILVYCRSGRRSKAAAQELVSLGYKNVKDFGGIIDWEYETVKN